MATSSENRGEPAERDGSAEESPVEESSNGLEDQTPGQRGQSVECPNCGRTFKGTYCPNCGQEVGRSVTMGEVVGGAFREVADIEGGFRATLVGLTIRPGEVLQEYLSGARKKFMSPGRYLTVAVLLYVGSLKGLSWLGIRQDLATVMPGPSDEEAKAKGFREAYSQMMQSEWFALVVTLLSAGIFALILWRLFGDKLSRGAEALAVGVFLVSHSAILSTGIRLVFMPPVYFFMGHPVNPAIFTGVGSVLMILYPAVAAHRCFGTGWKSAVKAVFGAFWAYIEAGLVGGVLILWYLVWTLPSFPGEAASEDPQLFYFVMGVLSVLYLIPLFIHACVEAYYRLG